MYLNLCCKDVNIDELFDIAENVQILKKEVQPLVDQRIDDIEKRYDEIFFGDNEIKEKN